MWKSAIFGYGCYQLNWQVSALNMAERFVHWILIWLIHLTDDESAKSAASQPVQGSFLNLLPPN